MTISFKKNTINLAVCLLCCPVMAQDDSEEENIKNLPVVHVTATGEQNRTYSREDMDNLPKGNRDISSVISDNPAVRRVDGATSLSDRGSLAPENFSFYGESPYQNQFQIDGISGVNIVNPQSSASKFGPNEISGFSQAYNLDTDLLDQIDVYDSRVPVEFGGFTGGVVDAKIKKPDGLNRWKISHSYNSSSLTKQTVATQGLDDFNKGALGSSSVWKKNFSTLQGDVRLSSQTAALFSYSKRESNVTRKILEVEPNASGIFIQKNGSYKIVSSPDIVENVFVKTFTELGGGVDFGFLIKYADRNQNQVNSAATWVGSGFENQQKSYGLSFDLNSRSDIGLFSIGMGVDQMNSMRNYETNYWISQNAGGTLGSTNFGGLGNQAYEQQQISIKPKLKLNKFIFGGLNHQVYFGYDFIGTKANFTRFNNGYYVLENYTSGSKKIQNEIIYEAGFVSTALNNHALYISDSIQAGDVLTNISMRVDRNNLTNKNNISPRLKMDWDIFGDGDAQLGWGWGRYYGMDMLGPMLQTEISKLQFRKIMNYLPSNTYAGSSIHNFKNLKTPYSDEFALLGSKKLGDYFELAGSYISRNSRDGLVRDTVSGGYIYRNNGRSDSDAFTLTLKSLSPYNFGYVDISSRIDMSWLTSNRNYQASQGWEAEEGSEEDIIEVDGVRMKRKDKPVSEFDIPRKFSGTLNFGFKKIGVNWGNRVNWIASRTGIALNSAASETASVQKYSTTRLSSYWTWDTVVSWRPVNFKSINFSFEVINLLNRMDPITVTSSSVTKGVKYLTGREIWVNASYEF